MLSGGSPIVAFAFTLALALIAPVVVLIIILAAARGRSRTFGVVGSILLIVGQIIARVTALLLPALAQKFDLSISRVGYLLVPGNVIGWVGLILLGVAVVVRLRPPTGPGDLTPPSYRQAPVR